MAFVTSIEKDDERNVRSAHPTQLACKYFCDETDKGVRVFQINSYGSSDREIPDKLSQTLQFDRRSAQQLFDALAFEFKFSTSK